MKRLVSTLNLSKEEWLRYRKCGITGTDAGAILGLNPYRSAFQVYHDKISDTVENIDNEAMRQGRDLEEYVAQRFTEATGLKVRRANAIYQSEEHPLLLADFDRLIVGQKAGLECKTVSPFSADKWADGKIPAHYMTQVNHYLAVSGFDCWYIAALIFGKELVIHKIISDKAVLDNLIAEEEHFWKYNVMPEIPPAPTGSEGDTQQINQMYANTDKDKTADLNPVRGLLDKRQELSDQIEQLEQEKTAIEQQVKLKMQDAAYGTAPGYKVSWGSSESKRVDSQRLKKEQPDIFNRYSKNVSSRRFTIIHAAYADDTTSNTSTRTATRSDHMLIGTNGVDTYSELSGDISVDINHYEIGEMPASTKEYYLSYGNDFDTAWLNAMYTDVYVYSGKYSNLDAWDQFTQYIAFYDEVVDYDNERAPAPELYDVYYAYDPDTEEEAGQCVDEVIRIAEESGAEIQFY